MKKLRLIILSCLMGILIIQPFSRPHTYPEINTKDSLTKKIEHLQIPTFSLITMNTQDLVTSVLDYPLIENMLLYSTYSSGYQSIQETFNGLSALEKRSTASTYLYQALLEKTSISHDLKVLEIIISQPVFYDSLTPTQQQQLEKHLKTLYHQSIDTCPFVMTRKEYH